MMAFDNVTGGTSRGTAAIELLCDGDFTPTFASEAMTSARNSKCRACTAGGSAHTRRPAYRSPFTGTVATAPGFAPLVNHLASRSIVIGTSRLLNGLDWLRRSGGFPRIRPVDQT